MASGQTRRYYGGMLRTHPTVVGRRLAPIPLCLASTRAIGQTITVHGVAFGSLHARPLAGAFVSVVGTNFMATSDGKGRFTIDSVRPGTYVIAMQHDVLDSIGLPRSEEHTSELQSRFGI